MYGGAQAYFLQTMHPLNNPTSTFIVIWLGSWCMCSQLCSADRLCSADQAQTLNHAVIPAQEALSSKQE